MSRPNGFEEIGKSLPVEYLAVTLTPAARDFLSSER
jgi:hypothetical protein